MYAAEKSERVEEKLLWSAAAMSIDGLLLVHIQNTGGSQWLYTDIDFE